MNCAKKIFSTYGSERTEFTCKKIDKLEPYLTPFTNTNVMWIKKSNTEIHEIHEENVGRALQEIN